MKQEEGGRHRYRLDFGDGSLCGDLPLGTFVEACPEGGCDCALDKALITVPDARSPLVADRLRTIAGLGL